MLEGKVAESAEVLRNCRNVRRSRDIIGGGLASEVNFKAESMTGLLRQHECEREEMRYSFPLKERESCP